MEVYFFSMVCERGWTLTRYSEKQRGGWLWTTSCLRRELVKGTKGFLGDGEGGIDFTLGRG